MGLSSFMRKMLAFCVLVEFLVGGVISATFIVLQLKENWKVLHGVM